MSSRNRWAMSSLFGTGLFNHVVAFRACASVFLIAIATWHGQNNDYRLYTADLLTTLIFE